MRVSTSIAPGTPRLRLRPETLIHGVAKLFGIVREVEVGDEGFDSLFLIEATADTAARLLTQSVRKALLEIANLDIPILLIQGGVAELRFAFEPTLRALQSATRALAEIRATPVTLALLR